MTVLCLLSRIYFSTNQTVSNGKTAKEAELQNESFFYHPPITVREPPQYMQNMSIKWVTSS